MSSHASARNVPFAASTSASGWVVNSATKPAAAPDETTALRSSTCATRRRVAALAKSVARLWRSLQPSRRQLGFLPGGPLAGRRRGCARSPRRVVGRHRRETTAEPRRTAAARRIPGRAPRCECRPSRAGAPPRSRPIVRPLSVEVGRLAGSCDLVDRRRRARGAWSASRSPSNSRMTARSAPMSLDRLVWNRSSTSSGSTTPPQGRSELAPSAGRARGGGRR